MVSANLAESEETVLIKLQGMFYNAYDDSAKVLHMVTGYKVKRGSDTSRLKCGFPTNALSKVVSQLTESSVSYRVTNKMEVVSENKATGNRFSELIKSFSDDEIVLAKVITSAEPMQDAVKPDMDEKQELLNCSWWKDVLFLIVGLAVGYLAGRFSL